MVAWRDNPTIADRAVGDAFGAPVEFCRRDKFEPVTEMQAGGYFKLPVGAWTDDTAMALCLADSLIEHPHLDQQDLLDRLCLWAGRGRTKPETGNLQDPSG